MKNFKEVEKKLEGKEGNNVLNECVPEVKEVVEIINNKDGKEGVIKTSRIFNEDKSWYGVSNMRLNLELYLIEAGYNWNDDGEKVHFWDLWVKLENGEVFDSKKSKMDFNISEGLLTGDIDYDKDGEWIEFTNSLTWEKIRIDVV